MPTSLSSGQQEIWLNICDLCSQEQQQDYYTNGGGGTFQDSAAKSFNVLSAIIRNCSDFKVYCWEVKAIK